MTRVAAGCPQCGAPIAFRWSAAVQTTCEHCRSILVRREVDLEKVGVVGDLPLDASPIQIGTEGRWRDHGFTVVGRIIYEYDRGGWNEWHLAMSDGTSAWLSDAQLTYAVTRLEERAHLESLRGAERPGDRFDVGGQSFTVRTNTEARFRGVEGELPFEYWDNSTAKFVDGATADGKFATIDYTESPPLVFVGEYAVYEQLRLENVRDFEGW